MKRLYTLLAGLTMAAGLMAQGQKLTGRIIDKDYYPMDKAKVTVKGTNISTTTDKNGNYVLKDVPLVLDSLEVTKGKKSYSESFPVKIKMKQAIMAKPVEWYVKAGYDMSYFTGEDFSTIKDGHGFHVGGGADIRMSRIMSFQPGLYLAYRTMEGCGDEYYSYFKRLEVGYAEVPLLFAWKAPIGVDSNFQLQLGGYFDIGLWGTMRDDTYDYGYSYNIFGKRFTGGAMGGIGFELKKHYLIGLNSKIGWTSWNHSEGFLSIGIDLGYKF